ncbi:hypothetical protein B7463_g882, partial [Scytalidium lignicola]
MSTDSIDSTGTRRHLFPESCTNSAGSVLSGTACVTNLCSHEITLATHLSGDPLPVPVVRCLSTSSGAAYTPSVNLSSQQSLVLTTTNETLQPEGIMSTAPLPSSSASFQPGGPISSIALPSSTLTGSSAGSRSPTVRVGVSQTGTTPASLQYKILINFAFTSSVRFSSTASPSANMATGVAVGPGSLLLGTVMLAWIGVFWYRLIGGPIGLR